MAGGEQTFDVRIVSFPEPEVPAALRVQVREIREQAWPSERGLAVEADRAVHDPALRPLSMLLLEGGVLLASLDILFKDIVHAGHRYAAGGLSTVVTRQAARRRGHGRRLVVAAREAMPALALDLGVFTCDRVLQAFYESAGWRVLPGAVLIGGTPQAPFPSDQPGFDKVTMAEFFSPAGKAGRQSFHHARIELYPGVIDKLW